MFNAAAASLIAALLVCVQEPKQKLARKITIKHCNLNQLIACTCMLETSAKKLQPIATALHLTTVVFACKQCDDNMRSVRPLWAVMEYPYTTRIQSICNCIA